MNNKPLNKREREVASVAADLLCKGSPATRIAKYCFLKGMTEEQIRTFCDKLIGFGLDIRRDVMTAVYNLQIPAHKDEPDYFICFGNRLKERLNENNSTEK